MKKLLILLLSIIIIVSFGFVGIRYSANADEQDNWFNDEYRESFSHYKYLRDVLGLHWDGDAKADYLLNRKYTKLRIEVDRYDECSISANAISSFVSVIEPIIDKPGEIKITMNDTIPLGFESYDSEQIRALTGRYKGFSTRGDEAVLYILCLNKYSETPSNIGLTVFEDGIVLFWETISELVQDNREMTDSYVISTLLHEFGHQLGVDHVENEQCIMAASVENPKLVDGVVFRASTEYCEEELEEIQKVKDSLYNRKQ